MGGAENHQDFYAVNETELENWVVQFRKVAVLSGVFEDFNLGFKLGEGNYAKVYQAIDSETAAVVAIKSIPKAKLLNSSQGASILVNEVNCMRRLDHPNILKFERLYEEDDCVHIVMEYVQGGDLFGKVISAGHFSERYSAVLARKMLSALAYMHENNIIHRDLKLENILMTSLDEDADIRLADFGFAAEMTPENLSVFCGSPGYVAPEILNKRIYDGKADVFSLGVIAFIMLSGSSPFFGRNVEETIEMNRRGKSEFDPQHWASVSEDAKDFVRMTIDRDPVHRLTAAEALKHPWIQLHNKAYFDAFEGSMRRPSFTKRRAPHLNFTPIEESKSAGLPKTRERMLSPTTSSKNHHLLPEIPKRKGYLTPKPTSIGMSGFTSAVRSPKSGIHRKSPASTQPGKRNITWKTLE